MGHATGKSFAEERAICIQDSGGSSGRERHRPLSPTFLILHCSLTAPTVNLALRIHFFTVSIPSNMRWEVLIFPLYPSPLAIWRQLVRRVSMRVLPVGIA